MSFMVLGLVILAVSLVVAIAAMLRGRLGLSCLMLGVAVMAVVGVIALEYDQANAPAAQGFQSKWNR